MCPFYLLGCAMYVEMNGSVLSLIIAEPSRPFQSGLGNVTESFFSSVSFSVLTDVTPARNEWNALILPSGG